MKNIITIVVGFIATLAIIGVIGQYFQAEYDAMEDRVAALEQQRDELQGEVNSVTDAIQVYQDENASLTDAYEKVKEEVNDLQDTTEEEEVSTEEEITTEEKKKIDTKEESKSSDNASSVSMVFGANDSTPGAVIDRDYDVYYEVEEEETTTEGYTYLGEYQLTAYEWTGNPCANGNYPTCSYTVACNSLPLGTRIYIEGYGEYVVEDRGASWHSSNWIDVYMGDYNSCIQFGTRSASVYLIN